MRRLDDLSFDEYPFAEVGATRAPGVVQFILRPRSKAPVICATLRIMRRVALFKHRISGPEMVLVDEPPAEQSSTSLAGVVST